MSGDDIYALSRSFAERCRKPYHAPVSVEHSCKDAFILTHLIAAIDDRFFGPYFDFKFGGEGDSGEVLARILDVLLESGVISSSLSNTEV